MASRLAGHARLLRELHVPGRPLVLPNAWDAASARLVVAAGFPAVATTSGGVARALGYEDHEQTPPEEMLAAVARIARAVDVPVTADLESGYGLPPAELVDGLLDAGAVGLNLEDTDHAKSGLRDPGEQAGRLAAVRDAATARGVDVVLNARVDVVLEGVDGDPVEAILARARAYLEAGASCVYPILLADEEALARVVRELGAPVNALLLPNGPSLARLAELGLARVSLGTGLERAATAFLRGRLERLASGGSPF